MASEQYCLRWNNHQSNLLGVCAQLLRDERLVDVTLACADEGRCIRAHKVVLSACSAYFRALFDDYPSARHPIVILKDVRFHELRTLVEFMYKGEVSVEYAHLSQLLKTAESLKVKGLAEMTREYKSDLPEQTEPEELVSRRPVASPVDSDRQSPTRMSPVPPERPSPPSSCKSPLPEPLKRPPSENGSSSPPSNSFGPPPLTSHQAPVICRPQTATSSPTPPHVNCDPLPGPSNLPPVQQVPLSLKKEVDWGGGTDDKNSGGESSSDYSRMHHDSPILDVERCVSSSPASSRASTPHFLPFPLQGLLEAGLVPPSLLGEEAFRCAACFAGFPSLWLLEQHAALQHMPGSASVSPPGLSPLDKPFVCEQCGQSYRYRSAYVKHREQNHRARLPADKLFSCDVCGMQFRYLKSFKKHRLNHALERLHGKTGENMLQSRSEGIDQGSDQVSSSNETLAADEEMTKTKIKEEPDVDENQGEGGGGSDTERLEADQDDTIDSRVEGGTTGTNTSPLLARSIPKVPENVLLSTFLPNGGENAENADRQRDRKFACPFCGKCVRSKENLKLHVRKHTGERPFVCLFCGRAFGGKSDLTRHLRIHTGERPYHCDMCGKCFARADYLSKHLTTHINTPR